VSYVDRDGGDGGRDHDRLAHGGGAAVESGMTRR
jgi:hypothetical protein